MSSCEACWKDSGGDVNLYQKLVKERTCTPEEQAGPQAEECPRCHRRTLHQYTGTCTSCSYPYVEVR